MVMIVYIIAQNKLIIVILSREVFVNRIIAFVNKTILVISVAMKYINYNFMNHLSILWRYPAMNGFLLRFHFQSRKSRLYCIFNNLIVI